MFTLNNIILPYPTGYDLLTADIYGKEAGRSAGQNAVFVGDIVATKRTMAFQWAIISRADWATISSLIDSHIALTLKFFGNAGTLVTASVYSSDRKVSTFRADINTSTITYWQDATVTFIEK